MAKRWAAGDKVLAADLNNSVVPTGAIMPFAGSAAPTDWLLCNGATVSQTTYATLFALIGHTYGSDPGGGNFILPDLRARVPIGKNADGNLESGATVRTNKALASVAGEETHVLTVAELAAHAHSIPWTNDRQIGVNSGSGMPSTGSGAGTVGSLGNDTAHNNLQPYLTLNFIIKI